MFCFFLPVSKPNCLGRRSAGGALIRGTDNEGGQAKILHAFELASIPFANFLFQEVDLNSDWQQALIPIEVNTDLPTWWYKIPMGYKVQEIEVGGLSVLNYGNQYTIDQLPKLNVP